MNIEQEYQKAREYHINDQYQQAKEIYEQLIEHDHDHDQSINGLGFIYEVGQGVVIDYNKAKKLYEQAMSLGNSNAMNNLANMYQHGRGVERNYHKAIELYKKAINLDNKYAPYNLGNMYHHGEGVERNYHKAIELYQRAISLGNTDAISTLSHLYNIEGININKRKTLELYIQCYIKNNDAILNEKIKELFTPDIIVNYETTIKELKDKIKQLEDYIIDLEYQPGGPGYEKSKQHFTSLLN